MRLLTVPLAGFLKGLNSQDVCLLAGFYIYRKRIDARIMRSIHFPLSKSASQKYPPFQYQGFENDILSCSCFCILFIQVIGSITGVRLILDTFPEVGRGPSLNVGIHHGALTEGLLTFAIITISLGLARKLPGSFYMKTWISSVSKLALHILGSDLTGGCMNPASVMGWAYARGDHITMEHVLVYWLAPIQATLLALWSFKLVVRLLAQEKKDSKSKSE